MAEPTQGCPPTQDNDIRKSEPSTLDVQEQRWKLRVAKADFFQKILISIVGACVAAVFYLYQANQTHSRYYSDLQSQRERSDADLRAKMFDTLFQAYFKNKIGEIPIGESCADAGTMLSHLQQEIVLSDLLARNFETVDVRPLFENIDQRLSDVLHDCQAASEPSEVERQAFSEREQLRRAAIGATSRQTESLQTYADAEVHEIRLRQCLSGNSAPEFTPDFLPPLPGKVLGVVKGIDEASVKIELAIPGGAGQDAGEASSESQGRSVPISVSFYDMPSLENVWLPDKRRLALTLIRLLTTGNCQRYKQEMEESLREDCKALLALSDPPEAGRIAGKQCARATLLMTLIPEDYIGPRDRPFLRELPTWASGSLLDVLKTE